MNQPQKIAFTPRERQVLTLLVAGLASKEVAHEMGVSIETVLWYSKRIYKGLKVHNRAAAVRVALECGLVARSDRARAERGAVPATVRPLIGRNDLLVKLDRLLDESRLVSLVGIGGMGKTSLATAVARRRRDRYADGVVDVRLDHIDDEPRLVAALAEALEISRKHLGADPWAALGRECRDHERLVVLDNFEQLNDCAARLHGLVADAPKLTLLVTSRLPLSVPGEMLVRIEGMECPTESDPDPAASEAVALFVDEVRHRAPERALTGPELVAVGEICRHLGGTPLAILLAACWAEVLPIARIVEQVADRPELLASDGIIPARHRRLDQVIDATIALRSAEERAALARMSVFADGFDRAAALHVTGSSIEALAALIRSSLLSYDAAGDRYRMHPLVEERARAEAKRSDEWTDTRRAHQEYYASLVRGLRRPLLGTAASPGQSEASRTLDVEQANVRRAWYTAIERGDSGAIAEMLEPIVIWCDLRTRLGEGRVMIRAALDSPVGAVHEGFLQLLHAWLAIQEGAVGPDTKTPEAALAQIESSGAPPSQALIGKVTAAFLYMGVHDQPEKALEILTTLESEREAMPAYWEARRLTLLALLHGGMGDAALALTMEERVLSLSLAAGELTGAHLAVTIAALFAGRLGELDRIPRFLEIGDQLMERLADEQTAILGEIWRTMLSLWRGEIDVASAFLEETDAIAQSDNASHRSVIRGVESLLAGLTGRRVRAEAARAAMDADMGGIGGMFPETIAWAEWGIALASAEGRDWQSAQTHLDRMAEIEGDPWCTFPEHVVLRHVIAALRLASQGDPDAARRSLALARAAPSRAHRMYSAWGPVAAIEGRA